MDAIALLHQRVSCPVLTEPGPSAEQLENIYKAALRAPDHGAIRPWRFLTVQGQNLEALGELFVEAALQDDPDLPPEKIEKTQKMPLRAPCMLVVIAAINPQHPKVPSIEQEVSAGCAAQNILHAAYAQGLGAMWRTGSMAYHPHVRLGLGLAEHETIIGYIYLGTATKFRKAPEHDLSQYVSEWSGR